MDSKKNTSKKAKYDIGIALGIFIISTLLGYFFNSYVTKDNISIENVELIPTYHSLEFNSELFSEIETLKENSFMLSGVGHNYPDELNENYRNLLSSQLKRDISKANAKISIIKKLKQSIEKGEIPIESQNLIRIYTLTPNQKITPQEILKRVDYHITSLTKLQQKETELLDEIQEFKKNRNGNCKISITFLNSGIDSNFPSKANFLPWYIHLNLADLPALFTTKFPSIVTVPPLFATIVLVCNSSLTHTISESTTSDVTFPVTSPMTGPV